MKTNRKTYPVPLYDPCVSMFPLPDRSTCGHPATPENCQNCGNAPRFKSCPCDIAECDMKVCRRCFAGIARNSALALQHLLDANQEQA